MPFIVLVLEPVPVLKSASASSSINVYCVIVYCIASISAKASADALC